MGKTVSTIKGVRKDAYFETVVREHDGSDGLLAALQSDVRFAGVLNVRIPRGDLARRVVGNPGPATKHEPVPETPGVPAPAATPKRAFDPFSIHTINVFKKEGADGLRAALDAVDDPKNLQALVQAQRIPVAQLDPSSDMDALRDLVVEAVAARIADRKAAAR